MQFIIIYKSIEAMQQKDCKDAEQKIIFVWNRKEFNMNRELCAHYISEMRQNRWKRKF